MTKHPHRRTTDLPANAERIVRRALRCLADPQMRLDFDCEFDGTRRRVILTRAARDATRSTIMILPWAVFDKMRSDGLIAKNGAGDWRISTAGHAWVRRRAAAHDSHQAQHRVIQRRDIEVDGTRRPASVNLAESPLAWLCSRRGRDGKPLLSEWQFQAGERLRRDFTTAQMTPRVTSSWNAAPDRSRRRSGEPGGGAELLDHVVAARARVRKALAAVGPELSGVLLDVCCFLKGIEEIERENRWPARSAKLVLQIALSKLARVYGMGPKQEEASTQGGRLRHWGSGDYRPKI